MVILCTAASQAYQFVTFLVYAELMNKQGNILAPMQGSLTPEQHVMQPSIKTGYIRRVGDKMT